MLLTEKKLRKIINKAIVCDIVENIIGTHSKKQINESIMPMLIDITTAGLALIPIGILVSKNLGWLVTKIKDLIGQGRLSDDVIVSREEQEYLNAKKLLEQVLLDPEVKNEITSGGFIKTDVKQPGSKKPKVGSITGNTPKLGKSNIQHLFQATTAMKNALGQYAIGARTDIKTGEDGVNWFSIDRLPEGNTLGNTIFREQDASYVFYDSEINPRLTLKNAMSILNQLEIIKKLLIKHKDEFVHGDLHIHNIWVTSGQESRVLLYDPPGLYIQYPKNMIKYHEEDIKRINFTIKATKKAIIRLGGTVL